MNQLYSRVFIQILDSSLAENWQVRHVFEDLLKLSDCHGVVDMTRQAISRRTNTPLEIVTVALDALESPDPASRDPEDDGRRIKRLDAHRDWGWVIVNWPKYDAIRSRTDSRSNSAKRVAAYRERKRAVSPTPPSVTDTDTDTDSDSGSNAALRDVTDCNVTGVTERNGLHGEGLCENPLELPYGFPKTEEEAKTAAAFVGVPVEFAVTAWHLAMGRNGKDAKGQPIERFRNYLKASFNFSQSDKAESSTQPKSKKRESWMIAKDIEAFQEKINEIEAKAAESPGGKKTQEQLDEVRALIKKRDKLKAEDKAMAIA